MITKKLKSDFPKRFFKEIFLEINEDLLAIYLTTSKRYQIIICGHTYE